MEITFQGTNNAAAIADIEDKTGGAFVSGEMFKGEQNGHKFNPGQNCRLVGLEDYPEFNGEVITITSIRADGIHGRAYYFNTENKELAAQLNWTYEYRLEEI